jgi:hypothetical protein
MSQIDEINAIREINAIQATSYQKMIKDEAIKLIKSNRVKAADVALIEAAKSFGTILKSKMESK